MNVWVGLLLLLQLLSSRLLAEEMPSFIIEGDSFLAHQLNVYNMGNFEQELSEAEVIQRLQEQRFEFSDYFVMEYNKYYYFRLLVDNKSSKPQKIFFRLNMQMFHSKAWLYANDKLQAFEVFPVFYDLFFTEIPPGRSTIIASRLSGGDVTGRASTLDLRDFHSSTWWVTVEQHVAGTVFGAVAIMILYNLGMFLFFRRIYFIYYTLYSAAGTYCLAIFYGYLSWTVPRLAIGMSICGLGLILFCSSALSLRETQPRLYKISQGLLVFCLAFGVYVWFHPQWVLIALGMPLILIFCMYVSVKRALEGFRPAIYLVVGWTSLLICICMAVTNMAFLGSDKFPDLSVYGFALEICFFSFAIGQKVRLSEQKALRESEHAFNQLKKVFYPHQINQIKVGIELEKTMPTGKEQAAVINFDIVESSKIRQPQAKAFIEGSIKSCVSIISENYDPDLLSANGYRIKEVGDGFLCSVGYPFALPPGMNRAECSVNLGLRFIKIFQDQVNELDNHHPVYCSIGIAADWLEGYFPKVGTIEYDVYGRAVILATRYESFRRQLFPQGVPGHILTLHEKIHEELPAAMQALFQEVDLQRAHLTVRDDLGAAKLYYRIFNAQDLEHWVRSAS